ncbi:ABC transporter ATP-binding protein [Sedimentibacter hydroxybenzoicus DSM 7310]|uniref:ABC transporter ATP-binding protein n=1 Tax=Sedimentibacter hydroxybenzoicus DSM 7310 TaxID=1123245 RepID=A0A974BGI3_SEDHY|nr:ABC transporter ATP-binding protein [Sedimentibacter hydroxybenzoicus]NYB72724.1 ABC transporter ATP-binding protein [Sedimentibacter hydroxybenzoicus DSM 7310]
MGEKILEIENLHVKYKTDESDIYAVNGLNLCLNKGETLGLVGETGAGKTTAALSILKLLPKKIGFITEGSVKLGDIDIINATDADMRLIRGDMVSMIFQDPMTSLNPILRIGEQIAEVLQIHKKDMSKQQIEERVDEILNLVGISKDRKNDYPHQFSGGMKQRVIIAIGLACEPDLLLADEPTTALDVTIQAQVLEMMQELKDKLNTSMILITHDLGVVAQICDRVAIMYAGQIIEIGNIEDIFEGEHHHPYTIGLFGSIPNMNEESKRLKPIAGMMPDPSELPVGCSFKERCASCMEICKAENPEEAYLDTHMIKCHLFDRKNESKTMS